LKSVVVVRVASEMATGFDHYIGIDYSGAQTAFSSLSGLRVYMAGINSKPAEVLTADAKRKYWSRAGVAAWLLERLAEDAPTIIGIDHGFSFPFAYFQQYSLPHNSPAFLENFQRHWPTDGQDMYVDFVRDGHHGNGAARSGDRRWRRISEMRTRRAKSVFFFDVRAPLPNPRMRACPGFSSCADRQGSGYTSGPLMAGSLLTTNTSSPKSIRRCGVLPLRRKTETGTGVSGRSRA